MATNSGHIGQKKTRGLWIALGVVAALGGCAVVAVLACIAVFVLPLVTQMARAPGAPLGQVAVGKPAPDFTGQTLESEEISLSDLCGSPVAINFWTTWCYECEAEMPVLESAAARYADDGLVLLAVDVEESVVDVQAFVDQNNLSLLVILDPDGGISEIYGIAFFPTTIWVDADGIVQDISIGGLTDDQIDGIVADLLED